MLDSAPVLALRRGCEWSLAIRVLTLAGALVVDGWAAAVVLLLVQEGGLWLVRRVISDARDNVFARAVFIGALALRVAIALVTHSIARLGDGSGALFQDDYTNDLVAEWLVRMARGEGLSVFPGHQHLLDGLYPYLLMGLYGVFGYAPLLPKLVNTGCAALSAVFVFAIARRTFLGRAPHLAALGAALLPTTIVWSIVTLKESLVLLLSLVGLWIVIRAVSMSPRDHTSAALMVVFVGVSAALIDLRATAAAILVALLLLVAFSRLRRRLPAWQLGLAVSALAVVALAGVLTVRLRTSTRPITTILEDTVLVSRHRRAQEANNARSQFRPEAEVLSPTGADIPALEAASDAAPFTILGDVFEPLGFALLAPAPWQAATTPERAAAAEMPIWDLLLLGSLFAWGARPRQGLVFACLVLYGIANWLVLAASEGNLGNLLRHRLMLDPMLLILGSAGLEWVWVRAGRPWSSRMPRHMLTPRAEA